MAISLANLKTLRRKKKKRVGRGNSSGKGNYAGRGLKGQRSRSGGRKGLLRLGILPTLRRIPKKRGFRSIHPKMSAVNIGTLNKHFKDGEIVDFKKLIKLDLVKYSPSGLKILGEGKLNKKLVVKAKAFSKKAEEAILKAGGKVEKIEK